MTHNLRSHWLFISLLGALGLFHFLSVGMVPFHPDESTYLYMSADFETYLERPVDLAWEAEKAGDPRHVYRTINAPITRYAIGLGRSLFDRQALPNDWNWSESWPKNVDAGALPDPALLWFARLPSVLFLELSLIFVYAAGCRIHGRGAGLLAAFLLASNSLAMVHARRAMTEAPLLFGTAVFLWSLRDRGSKPWLVAIAAGIALNAKHSGAALLPIGLLAVLWIQPGATAYWQRALKNAAIYLLTILVMVWMLNPFLWRDPLGASAAALENRRDLLLRQVAAIQQAAPEQILETPMERLTAVIANLYVLPPSFAEIGNYTEQTASTELVYMRVSAHNLLRGLAGGGVLLVLTLFGLIAAVWRLARARPHRRDLIALTLAATFAQLIALLVAVPLPWQRFVVPLIPFVAVWAAFGLAEVIRTSLLQVLRRFPDTKEGSLDFGRMPPASTISKYRGGKSL